MVGARTSRWSPAALDGDLSALHGEPVETSDGEPVEASDDEPAEASDGEPVEALEDVSAETSGQSDILRRAPA